MAKMTFLFFKLLEVLMMTQSFIIEYLDTSPSPQPHRLTTILRPTTTTTTSTMTLTTSTTTFKPEESVIDMVDNFCSNDTEFLVFLLYDKLRNYHSDSKKESWELWRDSSLGEKEKDYDKLLDIHTAEIVVDDMCKMKKNKKLKKEQMETKKQWMLKISDSNGDGKIDINEQISVYKIRDSDKYTKYLENRAPSIRRKRHFRSRVKKKHRNNKRVEKRRRHKEGTRRRNTKEKPRSVKQ